jgi:hypothetical protein
LSYAIGRRQLTAPVLGYRQDFADRLSVNTNRFLKTFIPDVRRTSSVQTRLLIFSKVLTPFACTGN